MWSYLSFPMRTVHCDPWPRALRAKLESQARKPTRFNSTVLQSGVGLSSHWLPFLSDLWLLCSSHLWLPWLSYLWLPCLSYLWLPCLSYLWLVPGVGGSFDPGTQRGQQPPGLCVPRPQQPLRAPQARHRGGTQRRCCCFVTVSLKRACWCHVPVFFFSSFTRSCRVYLQTGP